MGEDWLSTAADLFSAVGTVGAFVVGFVLFRREHRRESGRAENERRAQGDQGAVDDGDLVLGPAAHGSQGE